MTALESIIIVAVCAALGWVAARVYGWRRKRKASRQCVRQEYRFVMGPDFDPSGRRRNVTVTGSVARIDEIRIG